MSTHNVFVWLSVFSEDFQLYIYIITYIYREREKFDEHQKDMILACDLGIL